MACSNTPHISSTLHEAAQAVFKITQRNSQIQQSHIEQTRAIRETIKSFDDIVDEFEMLTIHLGHVNTAKSYFHQVQQLVGSVRRVHQELNKILASVADADMRFGQEIRSRYAEFLGHIASYTGDDTQPLVSLDIITQKFHVLNLEQNQRLSSMREQLDSYILTLSKIAALKHGLEEQGLI
ncbi:hypothetical protein FBEOM_2925 [Fusarium beomiforme]|uniref:Uncharacterized protein n=1 Tax=Fusarium beomiforme TaxID=44412 RepID=A0A9P5AR30_9HYPO|nr:hypothetical protein FBEOM_2925 [Fusarium beomiforme]